MKSESNICIPMDQDKELIQSLRIDPILYKWNLRFVTIRIMIYLVTLTVYLDSGLILRSTLLKALMRWLFCRNEIKTFISLFIVIDCQSPVFSFTFDTDNNISFRMNDDFIGVSGKNFAEKDLLSLYIFFFHQYVWKTNSRVKFLGNDRRRIDSRGRACQASWDDRKMSSRISSTYRKSRLICLYLLMIADVIKCLTRSSEVTIIGSFNRYKYVWSETTSIQLSEYVVI